MRALYIEKTVKKMLENYRNKQHREEVEEYLFIREHVDKVSIHTKKNNVQAIFALDKFLKGKPFEKATMDDMLQWEIFMEKEMKLSKNTIEQYETHVKRFYKYLSDKDTYKKGKRFQKNILYPDCVSWISVSLNNQNRLPLDKIMTPEDLMQMLNVCDNIRDQAMIVSFYDAGLRNSELISLNVESLGFDKLGAYFILPKNAMGNLKTGMRKIRLFLVPSSVQYLKDYINKHPFKKYKKAPLFYSRDHKTYPNVITTLSRENLKKEELEKELEKLRMAEVSVKDIVKNIAKRANAPVEKPHDLRHNSCTMASKAGLNEMELRIRYGWSPTSKMPSRYTHLASKDLDDKIKIITGFKEPEKPEDGILQPILCPNCDYENVPTNIICGRCGMKLNVSKEDLGLDATTTGIITQEMLKDSKFREFYKESLLMSWDKYKELQNRKKEVK